MEQNFYSIGKVARLANITAEALRHYDRAGLVKPSKTDPWTKYRYYAEQDIIRLNVVVALRNMGLSLQKIKTMLDMDDMQRLVGEFDEALRRADDKIQQLQEAKNRILHVKKYYESKRDEATDGIAIKELPPRTVLLSDKPISPTIEDLHDYHRHFYAQVGESRKALFAFEDVAGIYERNGEQKMFAVCMRHDGGKGLLTLPQGRYLCAECTDETYKCALSKLVDAAQTKHKAEVPYVVRMIKLTGILQWKYEIQILVERSSQEKPQGNVQDRFG